MGMTTAERASQLVEGHVGTFPEDYLRGRLVTGTPDEVVERISAFLDAGCTFPIIRFASWEPMRQMRMAMERVLPRLRSRAGASARG